MKIRGPCQGPDNCNSDVVVSFFINRSLFPLNKYGNGSNNTTAAEDISFVTKVNCFVTLVHLMKFGLNVNKPFLQDEILRRTFKKRFITG